MGDYGAMKRILRDLCAEYDEYVLLAGQSAHLDIERDSADATIAVTFGGRDRMSFPEGDVKVLPIENVTVEELSALLARRIAQEHGEALGSAGVDAVSVRVSSGPGQAATASVDGLRRSADRVDDRAPQIEPNPRPRRHSGGAGGFGEGKGTLVVTGGSRGIGVETVSRFIEAGYDVYNVSRSPCPVVGVKSLSCDLTDTTAVRATASELRAALAAHVDGATSGPICVVHNAAIHVSDSAVHIDASEMAASFAAQTIAPAMINAEMLPLMPYGSSIIFVGSTLSEKAVAGALTYSTCKHALAGLMRATAQDIFGSGIHTALVCPGFTDTSMLRGHLGGEDGVAAVTQNVSFGRLVDPGEIADIIFSVAGTPAYNGAVLHANLGQREF